MKSYEYTIHAIVALRQAPGASLCADEDCALSGGFAHVGPCEPCDCPLDHAVAECPALAFATAADASRSLEAARSKAAAASAEVERLQQHVNTPEIVDFVFGVSRESAHQRLRWGSAHDAGKTPADWFWLIGYLAGKALHSHAAGQLDKAMHHTIATAAALSNWHAAILGKTDMRPGIKPPAEDAVAEAES